MPGCKGHGKEAGQSRGVAGVDVEGGGLLAGMVSAREMLNRGGSMRGGCRIEGL